MNRLLYGFLLILIIAIVAIPVFGCKVTFINDTNQPIFAFDVNYNEGDIIEPGKQVAYGEQGRHPNVIIYTLQMKPGENTLHFAKAYKVEQKQCALYDEDKIAPMSKIVANNLPTIYEVINLANEMTVLPCCHHETAGHEPALDAPMEHLEMQNDAE
jgi:hypothetical protein